MLRLIRQTLVILLLLTVLTGLIYPLVITVVAQVAFEHKANGSLIVRRGKVVGSELIGQPFSDPRYFWSRPSATVDDNGRGLPYNGGNSGGSNLGPLSPALQQKVRMRVQDLQKADPAGRKQVPVDLVTASASGLDPDISVAAAEFQVPRVATARGIDEATVRKLAARNTEQRQLGVLGEPRVNVLKLNMALDDLKP